MQTRRFITGLCGAVLCGVLCIEIPLTRSVCASSDAFRPDCLAPESAFSSHDREIVVEMINSKRAMDEVFDFLTGLPNQSAAFLQSLRQPLSRDPDGWFAQTRVFVAREKMAGVIRGVILVNVFASKPLLMASLSMPADYPDPIGYLNAVGFTVTQDEKSIGARLLEEVETYLAQTHPRHSVIVALIDPMDRAMQAFMTAQGYVRDRRTGLMPVYAKQISRAERQVSAAIREESDPLEILGLIHSQSGVRALVNPPEGALKGLERKMRENPRKAAGLLRNAIPGIQTHFPRLGMAGDVRAGGQPAAGTPQKIPEKAEIPLKGFVNEYEIAAEEMEEKARLLADVFNLRDLEVLKLYLLVVLLRGEKPIIRDTVLSNMTSKNVLAEPEADVVRGLGMATPHEALTALVRCKPSATLAGVENLYVCWMDAYFIRGKMQGSAMEDMVSALKEAKICFTHKGIRIPLAIMLAHPALGWQRRLERLYLERNEPLRLEGETSEVVRIAATKDLLDALDAVFQESGTQVWNRRMMDAQSRIDAREALKHIESPAGDAVSLDVGTFDGAFLRELFRRDGAHSTGGRFIGIDKDEDGLEAAAQLIKEAGMTRLEFYKKDCAKIDVLGDESVDRVYAKQLMNDLHADDLTEQMLGTVKEMDRLLKPGGEAYFIDDGNTPVVTYRLLSNLGYELFKKKAVPNFFGHGDFLLLGFRKIETHKKNMERWRLPQASMSFPKCIRPSSVDVNMLAEQKRLVREAWATIPEPGATAVSPALDGVLGAGVQAEQNVLAPRHRPISPRVLAAAAGLKPFTDKYGFDGAELLAQQFTDEGLFEEVGKAASRWVYLVEIFGYKRFRGWVKMYSQDRLYSILMSLPNLRPFTRQDWQVSSAVSMIVFLHQMGLSRQEIDQWTRVIAQQPQIARRAGLEPYWDFAMTHRRDGILALSAVPCMGMPIQNGRDLLRCAVCVHRLIGQDMPLKNYLSRCLDDGTVLNPADDSSDRRIIQESLESLALSAQSRRESEEQRIVKCQEKFPLTWVDAMNGIFSRLGVDPFVEWQVMEFAFKSVQVAVPDPEVLYEMVLQEAWLCRNAQEYYERIGRIELTVLNRLQVVKYLSSFQHDLQRSAETLNVACHRLGLIVSRRRLPAVTTESLRQLGARRLAWNGIFKELNAVLDTGMVQARAGRLNRQSETLVPGGIQCLRELIQHAQEVQRDISGLLESSAGGKRQALRRALQDAGQICIGAQKLVTVLESYRIGNRQMGEVELEPLVLEALRRQDIGSTIRVDLGDLGLMPPVRTVELRIQLLLSTILENAVESMPDGGTLTFRARQEGRAVILEVEDTGFGMPLGNLESLFQIGWPYRRDVSKGRTGKGLAIGRRWIEAMGGQMDVRAKIRNGNGGETRTTFRLRLPAAAISAGELPLAQMLDWLDKKGRRMLSTADIQRLAGYIRPENHEELLANEVRIRAVLGPYTVIGDDEVKRQAQAALASLQTVLGPARQGIRAKAGKPKTLAEYLQILGTPGQSESNCMEAVDHLTGEASAEMVSELINIILPEQLSVQSPNVRRLLLHRILYLAEELKKTMPGALPDALRLRYVRLVALLHNPDTLKEEERDVLVDFLSRVDGVAVFKNLARHLAVPKLSQREVSWNLTMLNSLYHAKKNPMDSLTPEESEVMAGNFVNCALGAQRSRLERLRLIDVIVDCLAPSRNPTEPMWEEYAKLDELANLGYPPGSADADAPEDKILEREMLSEFKVWMAQRVGSVDHPTSIKILCSLLADEVPDVQLAAIGELQNQSGEEAVDALCAVVMDAALSMEVREQAAEVLEVVLRSPRTKFASLSGSSRIYLRSLIGIMEEDNVSDHLMDVTS